MRLSRRLFLIAGALFGVLPPASSLALRVREDFAAGRVVVIDGWVLAESEVAAWRRSAG